MPLSPQARTGLIAVGIVGGLFLVAGGLVGVVVLANRDKPTESKGKGPAVASVPTPRKATTTATATTTARPVATTAPRIETVETTRPVPTVTTQPPPPPEKVAEPRKPPDPPKPHATGAELLADLPKEAYPDGDAIEWAACQKWCEGNLAGRVVTWKGKVTGFQVAGDGPFTVGITTDIPVVYASRLGFAFGPPFKLGKRKCGVVLTNERLNVSDTGLAVLYENQSAEEAKALRGLKGREVTFRATISGRDAFVVDGRVTARMRGREADWLPIQVHVSDPEIDGAGR